MSRISLCLFAIVIVGLWGSVSATVTFSFLPADWYSWFWHGHVVVGNWIYIDGGEIWAKNGTSWNNFTMAIDLSKSWTTSDVEPVVSYHTNGYNMLTRGPSLWHDPINNKVFWYGGWPYYNIQPSVWSFTPGSDGVVDWGNQYSAGINALSNGTSSFNHLTSLAGALSVQTSDKFYSLGGYMASTNDPAESKLGNFQAAFTGMLEYDFASSSWTNSSSAAYQRAGFGILGEGLYVPIFGKKGILVFLGGDAPTGQAWGVGSVGSAMVAFTSITIYDIDNGTFYQQTAYGSALPIKRSTFCAVGVGAADNATWEIFVYGGYQGGILDNANLDQNILGDLEKVYILTLPAFEWVVAPSNTTQRHAHQCTVIGNRKMLSTGGVLLNNAQYQDPWVNGMALFDMVDLTWSFDYNSTAAPYVRSDLVVQYYNSSTSPYPVKWDSAALKSIFKDSTSANATTTAIITGNGAKPTSTSSSTTTPSSTASPSPLPAGTIAGIVIASVAGVALILSAAFLLWRRSRAKKQQRQAYQSAPQPYDLPPEMQHHEPRSESDANMINEALGDDGAVEIGSDRASLKNNAFWGKSKPLSLLKEPVEMDAGHGNVNEHVYGGGRKGADAYEGT